MNKMLRLLACAAAQAFAAAALADVQLPHLFTDHMVLQRDAKIPVWGAAEPGEKVTVTLAGQTQSVTADDTGRWRVTFEPLKADSPLTMNVQGKNSISVSDILVGEVWICSGQSNMEWRLDNTRDAATDIPTATNPSIRLFNVSLKKHPARKPAGDVEATWEVCSPESAKAFSAVGYYFGRHLNKELGNVPIGLINAAWGGMPAEAFTPMPVLEGNPAYSDITKTFAEALANYPTAKPEYEKKLAEWEIAKKAADEKKEKAPPRPSPPLGPDSPQAPAVLWNGMIHPLVPYAFRGAIWYQGETNAGSIERSKQYRTLLHDMIGAWRQAWGNDEFPFLVVQLANWKAPASQPAEPESSWAMMREAQDIVVENTPKTGLAVIIDIGDDKDIHPRNKVDVGIRLGLAAEKIAYGKDVVFSGPKFKSMSVDGNKAVLSFDHVGGGLMAKGDKLEGFAITSGDGTWHAAEASIEGDKIAVTSPEVAKPTAVRYAWANNPKATLYNKQGLPAVPFRSDRD